MLFLTEVMLCGIIISRKMMTLRNIDIEKYQILILIIIMEISNQIYPTSIHAHVNSYIVRRGYYVTIVGFVTMHMSFNMVLHLQLYSLY